MSVSDSNIKPPLDEASAPRSYRESGIDDVTAFYEDKFLSTEILDPRYFRPLDRFDMHFARTLWVYDNVCPGTSLLDIGCGVGLLALLKRKNILLSGVDISERCVEAARANGYGDVRLGELTSLPFPDASFDYVASLDVIGHVSFEEKDQVLCEIKRVLKPGGVTLHGIECLDPTVHKSYEEMSAEELRRFVAVDGHIGLERGEEHAARFGRIFKHVLFEPRYILCLSSEEFIKQADEYDLAYDADFLEYLRNLSPSERRAFDIAMGYVFNRISDLHIKLPSVGLYAFLKASDSELGPFYNEHRDRSNVLGPSAKIGSPHGDAPIQVTTHETSDRPSRTFWLDLSPDLDKPMRADFDDGWYAPDILPPVARWMRERARIKFEARDVRCLTLDLTTHLPDLSPTNHQEVHVSLNGVEVAALSIFRYGWLQLRLPIPEALRCAPNNLFELTLRASRTFKPRPDLTENRDDRDLSIAVCNIGVEVAGLPDP